MLVLKALSWFDLSSLYKVVAMYTIDSISLSKNIFNVWQTKVSYPLKYQVTSFLDQVLLLSNESFIVIFFILCFWHTPKWFYKWRQYPSQFAVIIKSVNLRGVQVLWMGRVKQYFTQNIVTMSHSLTYRYISNTWSRYISLT